jgi:hypothetical protein
VTRRKPNSSSETDGRSHNPFRPPQQHRPTFNLTDELLNSCNSFRSCAAYGSPCVFVIISLCATGL